MKPLIFWIIVTIFLAGCSALAPKTTSEIAKYIDTYCLTADEIMRQSMRNEINALTQIGDIEVTCARAGE
ncbi:MAG: hypothetical protein KJO69_09670 [Gammaproteobacteria bacterium]|nr:hypothetical protein [Gammaproteobacteria bacterium]